MKKIKNRALAVLLIAAMIICGMTVYVLRYIDNGRDWALYFTRANSGSAGQLVDRNDTTLAYFSGYENLFSADPLTRIANYHVTGDYWGRTGTGVLSQFWSDMQSFDLVNGTTQAEKIRMKLNIDIELNNIIYTHLDQLKKAIPEDTEPIYDEEGNEIPPKREKCNGAMLVCNYRTGELLGMVSTPSVDPMYAGGDVPEGAYLNRCLSASFVPGSIFKLVTAAAAIENIPDIDERMFYCEDEYYIAGVPIKCVVSHYNQTFEQALANSCNVAFSQIAVMLGQDTMVRYVTNYGLLDTHSLDGIPTVGGSYPTEFVGDPEIGWSGIGQSTDLVCPYSMLRLVCAIANDGVLLEPKLIDDGKEPLSSRFMEASTARKLKQMMAFNVASHYGGEDSFPGLHMCAKTGTAEIGDGTSHAWFVGFLDDEEHPYAFVTLAEQGGGGLSVAGHTTNKIFQEYLGSD
ncbi:MAG: penicillin-binding transpeptidase domain-containing protein [Candidatus Limivicinus sp.]|jgi:peptidoglycan glycosyltransferase